MAKYLFFSVGSGLNLREEDISRAVAEACNAGPHATMVDMVDLDNSIFYGNLSFITAMAITKNA